MLLVVVTFVSLNDSLLAVRVGHPLSALPHRVMLICGPAKAMRSGLCLPPASWPHAL